MEKLKIKHFVILITLSLLLVFLDSRGGLSPLREVGERVAAPGVYGVYLAKLKVGETFSFLKFWRSGEARIRNLEQRNLELVVFEKKAKDLAVENEELRKQLAGSGQQTAPRKLLPARVLGVGQYLEIDVAGLEGRTVVYLGNLVGKVARSRFVQLPLDPDSKIPVRIGRVNGLVSGQYNSSMLLDKVAQNEEIKINDLVITSGEGGSYEPGLIVGRIKKIVSQGTDLFQKAEVEPLFDYRQLILCYVIIS